MKTPPRKSRLDPFKPAVDQMLRADLDAPRKQRHTLKRIFDRLVAEHEMEGVTYSTVGDYVRWRRPEIRVEEGRGPAQVFIPQAHQPGGETGGNTQNTRICMLPSASTPAPLSGGAGSQQVELSLPRESGGP
jgi:hypothetical protein